MIKIKTVCMCFLPPRFCRISIDHHWLRVWHDLDLRIRELISYFWLRNVYLQLNYQWLPELYWCPIEILEDLLEVFYHDDKTLMPIRIHPLHRELPLFDIIPKSDLKIVNPREEHTFVNSLLLFKDSSASCNAKSFFPIFK